MVWTKYKKCRSARVLVIWSSNNRTNIKTFQSSELMIHLKLALFSVRFWVRAKNTVSSLWFSTIHKHGWKKSWIICRAKKWDTCFDRIRRFYPYSSNGWQLDVWRKKNWFSVREKCKKTHKNKHCQFQCPLSLYFFFFTLGFFLLVSINRRQYRREQEQKVWKRISRQHLQWAWEEPHRGLFVNVFDGLSFIPLAMFYKYCALNRGAVFHVIFERSPRYFFQLFMWFFVHLLDEKKTPATWIKLNGMMTNFSTFFRTT